MLAPVMLKLKDRVEHGFLLQWYPKKVLVLEKPLQEAIVAVFQLS